MKDGFKTLSLLALMTAVGFLVMGYHPGTEDDAVYLAAVKAALHSKLYPHDGDFVRLQTQATMFVPAMAGLVRFLHVRLAWVECVGQFLSLLGILYGALGIARRLFPEARAHWAGVMLLSVTFTLPVSGTALYIADQHLHPRTMATALILVAIGRMQSRKALQSMLLLLAAFSVHPIMATFGASLCACIGWAQSGAADRFGMRHWFGRNAGMAAAPLGWIFEPSSASWRQALSTRTYYFLYQWRWYEWLGALAPLALFFALQRIAGRREDRNLSRFALGVLLYGVFQQIAGMLILANAGLVRLMPLQPMRYLQLIYILMIVIGGSLAGRYLLRDVAWRWCALALAVGAGMFIPQRLLFASTEHIEWPCISSHNAWLQAYDWIRNNTPEDAFFALDPRYLASPGNDEHGFRALAERSHLSDAIKDPAVVTQVPRLGPEWLREQQAMAGWDRLDGSDFRRLRSEFGVDWVLLKYRSLPDLECVWHNDLLEVCRIPQ
ncbi:MAG TPA: hypothetical protein VGL22_21680 [Terracidiphilus sp.]